MYSSYVQYSLCHLPVFHLWALLIVQPTFPRHIHWFWGLTPVSRCLKNYCYWINTIIYVIVVTSLIVQILGILQYYVIEKYYL